jgi:hypothetical protein
MCLGLEQLKIETSLRGERFENVKDEYVIWKVQVDIVIYVKIVYYEWTKARVKEKTYMSIGVT